MWRVVGGNLLGWGESRSREYVYTRVYMYTCVYFYVYVYVYRSLFASIWRVLGFGSRVWGGWVWGSWGMFFCLVFVGVVGEE